MKSAADGWRDALQDWAIPEGILAAAPESPYGFPGELFRRRAALAVEGKLSPAALRALEALPERGTVLDVGVGAGAASLPLAGRAGSIIGVDESERMLDAFLRAAGGKGVSARAVRGTWPDVASQVESADMVVCHHVLYNVQVLAPFVLALTDHSTRRVVVEITESHPWAWMAALYLRFHGLERPRGPTADDAEEALRELGVPVRREDRVEPARGGFERRDQAVALVRRRLCLAEDRDDEVAEALGGHLAQRDRLWSAGPAEQVLVTLWWDRSR